MRDPDDFDAKWINADEELPEKDGYYWVSNHPEKPFDFGTCQYDGFGFISDGIYRNVKYWANPKPMQKKYGNLKTKID